MSKEQCVQEWKLPIFFYFVGEFEPRVDFTEAVCKLNVGRFSRILTEDAKCIVHVDLEAAWDRKTFFFGEFDGFQKSVVHPYFGHYYHKGQANRARIRGSVVGLVIDEVRGGETKIRQIFEVGGRKGSARGKGRVVFQTIFDDGDAFFKRNGGK